MLITVRIYHTTLSRCIVKFLPLAALKDYKRKKKTYDENINDFATEPHNLCRQKNSFRDHGERYKG